MTLEEKWYKKATREFVRLFTVSCIYMTVLFVLECLTAHKRVYFVCGILSYIIVVYVSNVFKDGGNDEKKL